jgi:RNA polymerase sigma-19 factor, ECF subfamily
LTNRSRKVYGDTIKNDQSQYEADMVNNFIAERPNAFEAIFEHYHRALYCHAIRFVKSPDLASDIVQDVFIKLLENRASIKPEYPLRNYLFTIARNHLLNILRRAACEAKIKNEILAHTIIYHNQEDDIIYNDFETFADRAIECLPPQRKRIFKMFKEEGKDYHEIASALGISRHTVRDHLAKASKFVRGYLRVHTGVISNLLISILIGYI